MMLWGRPEKPKANMADEARRTLEATTLHPNRLGLRVVDVLASQRWFVAQTSGSKGAVEAAESVAWITQGRIASLALTTGRDITALVGLGRPVDLFVSPGRQMVLVQRCFNHPGDGLRLEVHCDSPAVSGQRRSWVPYLHVDAMPLRRGPFAVAPSGTIEFAVALRENIGEVSLNGVASPVALPDQPISAALGEDGTLWVSLVDGRLLVRPHGQAPHVRAARRYDFMAGGPGVFAAGWSKDAGVCVHDAEGTLRAELPIRSGHFAFKGAELVALEANGPVWIHRVDLAGRTHRRCSLERSVDVLAIAPWARAALTRAGGDLLWVDLETLEERRFAFPEELVPVLGAFESVTGAPWVLARAPGDRWRLVSLSKV